MTDPERRYTLDEARRQIREDNCRTYGHTPGNHIVHMGGSPLATYCDCGLYRYEPVPTR